MISLESCSFPNHHVGIQNNGHVKQPATCARGPHASFTVKLLEAAGPSSSQFMKHGNTVRLICNSTGNPLRIKGGVVDGLGSRGGPFSEHQGDGILWGSELCVSVHFLQLASLSMCAVRVSLCFRTSRSSTTTWPSRVTPSVL